MIILLGIDNTNGSSASERDDKVYKYIAEVLKYSEYNTISIVSDLDRLEVLDDMHTKPVLFYRPDNLPTSVQKMFIPIIEEASKNKDVIVLIGSYSMDLSDMNPIVKIKTNKRVLLT